MIYNWTEYIYQIDDAALLVPGEMCGKIIMTECDGLHIYVDPCTVVSDCLDNLGWPTIDRCEMVTEIPGGSPGAFLRIDNAGTCVERIDPDTVFATYNTDGMVAVDALCTTNGVAGTYLEDVLVSPSGSISITKNGCVLELETTGVESFLDLNDTPNSYVGHDGDILKVSGNSVIFVPDDKRNWATRYLTGNQMLGLQAANTIVWHAMPVTIFEGNPAMEVAPVFIPGIGSIAAISIPVTGMYHVWFNAGIRINTGVNAIKCCVMTGTSGNKGILLSAKEGVRPTGIPHVDEDRGETERFITFSEKGLVRLNAGQVVYFLCRVDSQAGNNVVPEVEIEGETLYTGDFSGGGGETLAYRYCGTTVGVSRYSNELHNADAP